MLFRSGIDIPQMVFERRADDLLDFNVIRLTEKSIWQAIENSGIPYQDWVAYKTPGEMTLNVLIEPDSRYEMNEYEATRMLQNHLLKPDNDPFATSQARQDVMDMIKVDIKVSLLPRGAFAHYSAIKRAEGADIAHFKPPHINPSKKVLSLLQTVPEVTAVSGVKTSPEETPVSVR